MRVGRSTTTNTNGGWDCCDKIWPRPHRPDYIPGAAHPTRSGWVDTWLHRPLGVSRWRQRRPADGHKAGRFTPTGVGHLSSTIRRMREGFDSETRLSWVLAALAGLIGAVAFTHSAGYFVTFMTGNTERAALAYFRGQPWLAITAVLLVTAFVGGVVVASLCRRHVGFAPPQGPPVLPTLSLAAATTDCIATHGWSATGDLSFEPIPFVAFGIGALNTSFVKDGEVSTPLSYVTGTLVKMGQGIERHISGGSAAAWLGYILLYISFIGGRYIAG